MASEILGLFASPELYQQQQDVLMQQQAATLAQMDPYASVRYGLIRSGQQAGAGLANLLGAQDPQLRVIAARQNVMRSVDPADPQSIAKAAEMLMQAGDQQGALTLADYARKASSELALQQQRLREGKAAATPKELQIAAARAQLQSAIRDLEAMPPSPERDMQLQTAKDTLAGLPIDAKAGGVDTNEIKNARALALRKGKEGTPEYEAEYAAQLERLTTKEGKANIKEVGVAAGTNKAVFLDVNNDQLYTYQTGADGKQIRVPYDGAVDRTTAKVSASANAQQETEFRKGLGRLQAKRYDEATGVRDNAIAALNSLDKLAKLDQQGLISGAYAANRVGLTNFLDTIGVLSGSDKQKLSSSENYQKVAGDIVLATLGGRLGAGFSNEDRKFIQGLVPQLETSPLARKQLLDFLVRKNQSIVEETTRLMDYAENKGTLSGFVPKIPIVTVPQPGTVGAMTDAQLMDALKKAKSQK